MTILFIATWWGGNAIPLVDYDALTARITGGSVLSAAISGGVILRATLAGGQLVGARVSALPGE